MAGLDSKTVVPVADVFTDEELPQSIIRGRRMRGVQVAEEHVDLDRSGGKLQSPGFEALMERIRSGQILSSAVAGSSSL
jgi:hypothetical protein